MARFATNVCLVNKTLSRGPKARETDPSQVYPYTDGDGSQKERSPQMSIAEFVYEDTEVTVLELVQSAQSGDRDAMDQLYCRFQQHVLSIAYKRLGNWDEAQELSQDVFIQAFRRIHQLQTPEAFGGWLRQIVHRMAINRLTRRPKPASVDQEILEATVANSDEPIEAVLSSERARQVHLGLDRLGELDRQTLVAFYLDGQSLNQMSHAFDAPVGTIKRRLHVARKRLAKECETLIGV